MMPTMLESFSLEQNKKFSYALLATFILASILIALSGRSVISEGTDGFSSQMFFILDFDIDSWNVLSIVHAIRLLVISPCLIAKAYAPDFESSVLLIYALPLVSKDLFFNKYRNYFLIIFFLPLFISFRAFISSCGVAYLYLYLFSNRSIILFTASIVFAQLSSSIVLMYLLVLAGHYIWQKFKMVHAPYFMGAMTFLSASIAISVIDKISFFNSAEPARLSAENGDSGLSGDTFLIAVSRNTIFDSLTNSQPIRFAFYCALLLTLIYIIYTCYKRRNLVLLFFFVPSLLTFMFEGLGPLSMIIVFLFYFIIYPSSSLKCTKT